MGQIFLQLKAYSLILLGACLVKHFWGAKKRNQIPIPFFLAQHIFDPLPLFCGNGFP